MEGWTIRYAYGLWSLYDSTKRNGWRAFETVILILITLIQIVGFCLIRGHCYLSNTSSSLNHI